MRFKRRRHYNPHLDVIVIHYIGEPCGGLRPVSEMAYSVFELQQHRIYGTFRAFIRLKRRAGISNLRTLLARPCECGTHGT